MKAHHIRVKCNECKKFIAKYKSISLYPFRSKKTCPYCKHQNSFFVLCPPEDKHYIENVNIVFYPCYDNVFEKQKEVPTKSFDGSLTDNEYLASLRKLGHEICMKYNVSPMFTIRWNSRLTRVAGYIEYATGKIDLSYKNYQHFGQESMKGTFLHELAHHICYQLYGWKGRGHGENFKKICYDIGGTMNSKMAGEKYKKAACNDFLPPKPRKYTYECPCGEARVHRNRKMSEAAKEIRFCKSCETKMTYFTLRINF